MPDPKIVWNQHLRLALSDVDETIADVYTPADQAMVNELSSFLQDGFKLFMVSGGSLGRMRRDIIDRISPHLRKDILVSHCSGSEVWGFKDDGELRDEPFYSVYEERFTPGMKETWREVVGKVIDEFELRTHDVRPKPKFWETIGRDMHDIMLEDRGPQITLEVVNGIDLSPSQLAQVKVAVPQAHDGRYDLRLAIMERARQLLAEHKIPITARLGGTFAVDLATEGVSKTTSIKTVLADREVLSSIGLTPSDVQNPHELEIWGDKFSVPNGGTDRHMCEAVSPQVRAIDFREEDPAELPDGFNIQIWQGEHHLHDGLLEYLHSRKN